MEENLTRTQRRALPVVLAEKTIEAGCRSAGIVRQTNPSSSATSAGTSWTGSAPFAPRLSSGAKERTQWRFIPIRATRYAGTPPRLSGGGLHHALKMKEMTEVNARIDVLERTVAQSRGK